MSSSLSIVVAKPSPGSTDCSDSIVPDNALPKLRTLGARYISKDNLSCHSGYPVSIAASSSQ
eukprot:145743-Pyramimonas_sp.AAC.1